MQLQNHSRLVPFPLEKKTGPEVIEDLAKRLLAMQAAPAGQFLVDGDIFDNRKCAKIALIEP
jgi:hypothetical protein